MRRRYPNAIGGSYDAYNPLADCERTVNFYVEHQEVPGVKNQSVLNPSPGARQLLTTTGLQGRGLYEVNGRCLAVIGDQLIEITTNPVAQIPRGTVAVDANPVTMCSNGGLAGEAQIFITSGNQGYIFDPTTNVLTQVRVGATSQGGMLDTYFLALDAATGTLFLSDLNNGTVWDSTQFARRSVSPDSWIALAVNYRNIWLFGPETTEVWYNAGSFPFPYTVHPSGLIPYGIAAAFSVKNIGGTLLWLARTVSGASQVVAASGFQPKVVSTKPLEFAIQGYPRIDDAIGDTFQLLGHTFYVLTFPTAGHTWVYDLTSGLWTEFLTWDADTKQYIAWRPLFHAFFNDIHFILDRAGNGIYELSHTFGTDVESRVIRRLRRFPGSMALHGRLFYIEFMLYMEVGLGLVTGQGSNPQVSLRWSNNGGKTWGSERWRSAGRIGEYRTRVNWNQLGAARDRVFEISMTDPVPWRIIDVFVDIEGEAA